MARNVEIKARLGNISIQRNIVCKLADSPPATELQIDFFFNVPRGRMKLRQLSDESGHLIFYDRPDHVGPKTSEYIICPTDDPKLLRTILETALGIRGVVRKTREIFMVGRTRIHLDQVENLGEFLELEVVLETGEASEAGQAEAERLMALLRICPEDLVASAYIDLLPCSEPAREADQTRIPLKGHQYG